MGGYINQSAGLDPSGGGITENLGYPISGSGFLGGPFDQNPIFSGGFGDPFLPVTCPPGSHWDTLQGGCTQDAPGGPIGGPEIGLPTINIGLGGGAAGGGLSSGGTPTSSIASTFFPSLNPFSYLDLERIAIFLLGLILVIGGIYLLKPAVVQTPVRAARRSAEIAAAAA